jgi:hypothetical protein
MEQKSTTTPFLLRNYFKDLKERYPTQFSTTQSKSSVKYPIPSVIGLKKTKVKPRDIDLADKILFFQQLEPISYFLDVIKKEENKQEHELFAEYQQKLLSLLSIDESSSGFSNLSGEQLEEEFKKTKIKPQKQQQPKREEISDISPFSSETIKEEEQQQIQKEKKEGKQEEGEQEQQLITIFEKPLNPEVKQKKKTKKKPKKQTIKQSVKPPKNPIIAQSSPKQIQTPFESSPEQIQTPFVEEEFNF